MIILEALVQLRDDLKTWVTNNLKAINKKIDEKTIPIDSELSSTSTNPVQNKVISEEISSLNNLVGDTSVATQISTAIASQDLFSGDYNDLTNAPNITEDDSDNVVIADASGNVVFKVDAEGTHTTNIEVGGISLADQIPIWDAKSDFSGSYNDLTDAPAITEDTEGSMIVVDESGNIIFKVDAEGAHTTTLDAKNITIESQNITDILDGKIAALVNSAPETLDTLGELADAMETNSDAIEALEVIATSKAPQSALDATNADVAELQTLVGDTSVSTQIADAIANQEHFSGDYNDLINAPDITEDTDGNMTVVDDKGNIILRVDEAGVHTTALSLNGRDVNDIIGDHTGDSIVHISAAERSAWNNKVDKVAGKGLSANDFTDAEKAKLAALDPEATKVTVDSALSANSTNPVQNKVVNAAINELDELIGGTPVSEQISNAIAKQKHFSGDYNDLYNAPDIMEDGTGEMVVADNSGNIIFRVDDGGIYTTEVTINGKSVDDKIEEAIESLGAGVVGDHAANTTVHITESERTAWNNKVDKVSGKGLSTNDFTAAYKTKLDVTNIAYGTCSTAAATAAKVITISGNTNWKLAAGSFITVLFSATNTAASPTFNVNGTGAKNVFYENTQITSSNKNYAGYANRPMNFMYDGTQYRFIGWGVDANSDTKVTQAAAITTAGEYPVILGYSTATTAVTNTVNKAAALTYNPSTKVLTATTFKGALSGNATSATKATQDGSGNVITSTYAKKSDIPTVPTKTSQLTNDSNFLTAIPAEYVTDSELASKQYATESFVADKIAEAQLSGEEVDLSEYAKKTDMPTKTSQLTNDSNFLSSIPSEYITETELNAKGYLTQHQSLADYATKTHVSEQIQAAVPTELADLTSDSTHRTVSDTEKAAWNAKSNFSGSYSDLTDKPSINDDGSSEMTIADKDGNIIFSVDSTGAHVTDITINGMSFDDKMDEIKAYIDETILGGVW